MLHVMIERLLHWFLERVGVPAWVFAGFFLAVAAVVVPAWALLDWIRYRQRIAALRTLALQRGGGLLRGWRFWSPVAVIGDLRASVSPAWIEVSAPTAGRLWLDSRDIPDRRVKKGREERCRTGDWAFDEAFDAVASSAAFAAKALDGDVRNDLLKLDALTRRTAPQTEEGKSWQRLRLQLDGRRLRVRFRYALDAEDFSEAVAILERLGGRLRLPLDS